MKKATEDWVRLCAAAEAPSEGNVMEVEAAGAAVCLARIDGALHALDNWCPHRRGPLGQGWVEGQAVVCPWHSWAFNCETGQVAPPDGPGKVDVFPVKEDGGNILVQLG